MTTVGVKEPHARVLLMDLIEDSSEQLWESWQGEGGNLQRCRLEEKL